EDKVVSHAGSSVSSYVVDKASEILDIVKDHQAVIAVDEVQFFDDEICEVANDLADRGYRVILAGLDTDFRGEPFGPMPKLITQAEFVTKLTAVCNVCGAPATRTQRIINGKPASYNDPVVLVGASESYEARCRHHHEVPDKPARK
ncbi:MAG: thymidine kinase, partial [Erysipelotrichaceae bacterium]|nr:thymidine kinase [Erysipelotrichaceae bacterium]